MVKKLMWPLACLLCTTAWGAGPRELAIDLTVPDTARTITIDAVYRAMENVWI